MRKLGLDRSYKRLIGIALISLGSFGTVLWSVGIYESFGFVSMFPNAEVNWLGIAAMGGFLVMSLLVVLGGYRLIMKARKENHSV